MAGISWHSLAINQVFTTGERLARMLSGNVRHGEGRRGGYWFVSTVRSDVSWISLQVKIACSSSRYLSLFSLRIFSYSDTIWNIIRRVVTLFRR